MDNMSKYDAILVCNYEDMINEWDERSNASRNPDYKTHYKGMSWDVDNPALYAQNNFGRIIQSSMNNWRTGYSSKVTDFGKWVTVEVTHHNFITGRSASKTFLIVFNGGPNGDDKGGGIVLSTNNKWRSISGVSQALSYIQSASSALESSTSAKL